MIFRNPQRLKIYFYDKPVDMRKSWNGLIALVKESMCLNLFSESLFVFSGRSGKQVKILYWDGNGFCIWMKKLEQGKFLSFKKEGYALSKRELDLFLSGVDMRKKHQELHFQ